MWLHSTQSCVRKGMRHDTLLPRMHVFVNSIEDAYAVESAVPVAFLDVRLLAVDGLQSRSTIYRDMVGAIADKCPMFPVQLVQERMICSAHGMINQIEATDFCQEWPRVLCERMEICLVDNCYRRLEDAEPLSAFAHHMERRVEHTKKTNSPPTAVRSVTGVASTR